AMDGYAVCTRDPIFRKEAPYRLPVHGESRAGAPLEDAAKIDHAVRIFTGAVIPPRCDSVVIQEDVERREGAVSLATRPRPGAHVRPPGHDVPRGTSIAEHGMRLGPFDLAWLTACGLVTIEVRAKLRLALFSTGDELRDAPAQLANGQIYDSNRFVLGQLL